MTWNKYTEVLSKVKLLQYYPKFTLFYTGFIWKPLSIYLKKKKKPVFKRQKQNILKSYIASTHDFQLFCYIKILWCFAFTGHCNSFQILFTCWIIRKYIGNLFSTKHFSWNDFNTHKKFDDVWMYNAFSKQFWYFFEMFLKVHMNSPLVFLLNYWTVIKSTIIVV